MAMELDPSVNFADAVRPADGGSSGGRAGAPQIRIAPASYPDGGATIAGGDRPNPREISNQVFSQVDADGQFIDKPNPEGISSLSWVWGQFLDHDITQTSNRASAGVVTIPIPPDDPVFAAGDDLRLTRSDPISGTGTSRSNPRQYDNDITAFIDGSNIYGSSQATLDALRVPGTARLRLTDDGTIAFGSNDPEFGNGAVTGDGRADVNIGLLAMHALFVREHNRMADELARQDPELSTEEVFEGARARVEAIMQAITYKEYLPSLIGENAIGRYSGFKSDVDPSISLEFSTAVYRMGHTLLSPTIKRMNEDGTPSTPGDIALRDAFQRRDVVEQTGIEAILRGMSTSKSQDMDTFMIEDVRSLLFGRGGPGTDLAALNIARGRDHGLPSYNDMRAALGLERRTDFAQITDDKEVVARLRAAYGDDISKLDLWVGGLAEDSVAGGMLGETFRTVMIDQFTRLRDGDRFWSEGRGFGAEELRELWGTTLSDVIRRNTDVVNLQDNAFLAFTRLAGGEGDDTIAGSSGRNLIIGNGGDDRLTGNASDDHIVGGAGKDRLAGLAGDNVLIGGPGTDSFVIHADRANFTRIRDWSPGEPITFANAPRGATPTLEEGRDGTTLRIGDAVVLVEGVRAADLPFAKLVQPPGIVLTGTAGADTLSGGAGRDRISGGPGDDRLYGGAEADTLLGGDGNDLLVGGPGADLMAGGRGNDAYVVDNRGDRVIERVGEGVDTVYSAFTEALQAQVENLLLGGTQTIAGFGNGLRNVIAGNSGRNFLDGGAGNDVIFGRDGRDTLLGNAGRDILHGGDGGDTFVFRSIEETPAGRGRDIIRDFTRGEDRISLAAIDADTSTAGDQAFRYIGRAEFSGTAGELRYEARVLSGDVDGDGSSDLQIAILNGVGLAASDFLL